MYSLELKKFLFDCISLFFEIVFKEIDEAYVIRRTHDLENHCSSRDDVDSSEILSAEMRLCFPNSLVCSDYQVIVGESESC